MIERPDLIAHEAAPAPLPKGAPRPWWEGRPFVAAMILLAFLPLLYPHFPPLVDLPGHMGRYKVALSVSSSPYLGQWYSFEWRPIGNLGVDLLVHPLAHWIGVEAASKLVVMCIPPLTVAGMLWVAREVHNRLPPTVAFALPIAFSHPFLYGFVNFSLSMALALLAMGLWLRLGRKGKIRLRAALFVPISFLVFFTHTFGWGTMGLLCFSAEAVRQHDRGLTWWRAGIRAAYHASAMALPIIAMIVWRTEASGGITAGWFDWMRKWTYLKRGLRDRWEYWDLLSIAIVAAVPLFALVHRRLALSRNLAFSGLILFAGFVFLPRIIFGSAYADMRMVPYMLALFVLAMRFRTETDYRLARTLAIGGLIFLGARIASTTASLAIAADHQREQLAALDHVPRGARLVTLEWAPCRAWPLERAAHLPGLAIVRREAFSNDQWPLAGASLLQIHYPEAGWFAHDPSQIVRSAGCRAEGLPVEYALRRIPRAAFEYLWLLNVPPLPATALQGWTPVWSGEGSQLFRRASLGSGRAAQDPALGPQQAAQ